MKRVFLSGLFSILSLVVSGQIPKNITIKNIPYPLSFGKNLPAGFTNSGDKFSITAKGSTDMYRAADNSYMYYNAPRLAFTPDANFILTVKISLKFSQKWDAGGIVLEADSLHYIKFAFEKDYTLKNRVVSVVTKSFSDDCNSMEVNDNQIYYKMAKNGDMILLYESFNGRKWYLVRELNFATRTKLKLGFLAQSPVGKGSTVSFSEIAYSTKKITDPYNP